MSAPKISVDSGLTVTTTGDGVELSTEPLREQIRDLKYAMVFVLIWVMAMAAFTAIVFFHQ